MGLNNDVRGRIEADARLQILKELAHVQDARARADDAQRIVLDRQHASLMQRAREIYRKLPPS